MAIHIHVHKKTKDGRPVANREKTELLNAVRKAKDLAAALANSTGDREALAAYKALDAVPNLVSSIKTQDAEKYTGPQTVSYKGFKLEHGYAAINEEVWVVVYKSKAFGSRPTLEKAKQKADELLAYWDKQEKDQKKATEIYKAARELQNKTDRTSSEEAKLKSLTAEYNKLEAIVRMKVGNL